MIALFTSLGSIVSCAGTQVSEDDSDGLSDIHEIASISTEQLALGESMWKQGMCYKCHRDDGTGGERAPDLTDSDWLHCDGSVEGILEVIIAGVGKDKMIDKSRPFSMNPATNLIKDEKQLEALAAFVWNMSRQE